MARSLPGRLARLEEAARRPPAPDLAAEAREFGRLVDRDEWRRVYDGTDPETGDVAMAVVVDCPDGGTLAYVIVGVPWDWI